MERDSSVGPEPYIVIFTDLDGSLLDHSSYDWEKANPALDQCRNLGIPVIMVSSKTRAEMEILRKRLGLTYPFISENGGGIFFPRKYMPWIPIGTIFEDDHFKWTIGTPYSHLIKSLKEIEKEVGCRLRGFSDMTPEEISHRTGLDRESSRLAALRDFDEPFVVLENKDMDIDTLRTAAYKRRLKISVGDRFYHLHGDSDKGDAVKKMIAWYEDLQKPVFTIALGDSPNDFSMLMQVDQPVLIRSIRDFPEIKKKIPGVMITKKIGPGGWNQAVLGILKRKKIGR